MKVKTLGVLAACGMVLTSFSVWSLTSDKVEKLAPAPEETSPLGTEEKVGGSSTDTPNFEQKGALELAGRLGHAWLRADAPGETFVLANVSAPTSTSGSANPVNLAVVIDRSGSMKGKRIANAIDAARGMVRRLRDGDVVSVIAYDSVTETLVPSTTIDASSRSRVESIISGITAKGETCISCGIDAAMAALRSRSDMVKRILLLSDGEPTAGVRDISGFRNIAESARSMNCPISSIGVDVDYNERLLSALALDSNGRHYFAENDSEVSRAFESELSSLVQTVARDAEVEMDFGPGVEVVKVFDRTYRRDGSRLVVPLGAFTTGEQKTVLVKVRVPRGAEGARPIANVKLAWNGSEGGRRENLLGSLATRLTFAEDKPAPLDTVIATRLDRTETADTLEAANDVFKTGDVAGARRRLQRQISELQEKKKAVALSAPSPARDGLTKDIASQEAELDKADKRFEAAPSAAPPGQAPQESRAGKAAPKRNTEAANPFRL
jgi:Ca-activated chloride channel family protein